MDSSLRDGALARQVLAIVPVDTLLGVPIVDFLIDGRTARGYLDTGARLSYVDAEAAGATVYHAGTKRTDAGYVTAGGRVLGVTALGDTLAEAIRRAYAAAEKIHFEGAHMRRDIGQSALKARV